MTNRLFQNLHFYALLFHYFIDKILLKFSVHLKVLSSMLSFFTKIISNNANQENKKDTVYWCIQFPERGQIFIIMDIF